MNLLSQEGAPKDDSFTDGALASDRTVVYQRLYKFRQEQRARGVDISDLSDCQMGYRLLDKCHHISNNHSVKEGYRVRVCKTCTQESAHIELGTYVDQESAIIVNDAHEIMCLRYNKFSCTSQTRLAIFKSADCP